MIDTIFGGIFDTVSTQTIKIGSFLACLGAALLLGLIMALCYTYKTRYTKSFLITLALLPAVVCVIIMMVNGNIGAGVAVAGAFSLVRFRSAPGTAREIVSLFLAMGTGLIAGMGYIGFAALFSLIMCTVLMIYNKMGFSLGKTSIKEKELRITIPEDLDYTDVFEDILNKYTTSHELIRVKSSNMGSMFKLRYDITMRDVEKEKALIDELRTRNGNLEISISVKANDGAEL